MSWSGLSPVWFIEWIWGEIISYVISQEMRMKNSFCKCIKHIACVQQEDIDNYCDGDQIKFNMSCWITSIYHVGKIFLFLFTSTKHMCWKKAKGLGDKKYKRESPPSTNDENIHHFLIWVRTLHKQAVELEVVTCDPNEVQSCHSEDMLE